jgi:hypothetical protein
MAGSHSRTNIFVHSFPNELGTDLIQSIKDTHLTNSRVVKIGEGHRYCGGKDHKRLTAAYTGTTIDGTISQGIFVNSVTPSSLAIIFANTDCSICNCPCSQISLLFFPEMSASLTSYIVHMIYIALAWILYTLHFSLLPLI